MISLNHVSYEIDGKEILHDVSFTINSGEKIGIVGPNGAGKTTLLKLIDGDLVPTSGEIVRTKEEIGMLPQDLREWLDHSVYGFIEEVTRVKGAREQFDGQYVKLEHDSSEHTLLLYADALERYDKFEVVLFGANLEKTLRRAGIASIDVDKEIGNFSGGQRTRIALAAVFASHYDIVLLDEPTNNLDEKGVVVLEKFIKGSNAAFLIVSHDRHFLRNAAERIIELTGGKGVNKYNLGYDEYIEARREARQAMTDRYEQYEKEKKRLYRVARDARIRANSAKVSHKKPDSDKLNDNFRKERASSNIAGAAGGVESRLRQLDEPERVEDEIAIKFAFDEVSSKKHSLISVQSLSISHDGEKMIGPVTFNIRSGDKVLLTGENGAGKTSVIRGIIGDAPVSSGDVHASKQANVIYVDQNQTLPLPDDSALNNLRHLAPSLELHDAINLLIRFNLKKDIIQVTPGRELSGGERAKVLLAGIAANNAGLLILDEPTNNLDIPTIEALEHALKNYNGGVLIVSHDRDFVQNIGITNTISIPTR
ncbi:ATP-binding cassette domain-containing protein [Candidatus Minimicrobia vallesae]|uniref:ATP-binding cassette domain-containing protein n=1 Tax=Candidatus Minimicrobia vallesae TaxID=2841264 RepID=A0A8F1MA91_9BACT|nr:ABC-F family ATP-binding cassette domain-containing protein [Candidatus Minimicrobia vallesae]QWQ31197.1 ATP-binding cassette domain-containing protein [Candidatus Minimicrobia vallesae]